MSVSRLLSPAACVLLTLGTCGAFRDSRILD